MFCGETTKAGVTTNLRGDRLRGSKAFGALGPGPYGPVRALTLRGSKAFGALGPITSIHWLAPHGLTWAPLRAGVQSWVGEDMALGD